MIHELFTNDFAFYRQEIREAKDDYTKHKIDKDRRKAHKWISEFLKKAEIILTYKNGNDTITTIATLNVKTDLELPQTPMTHVTINGKQVLEDQYLRFYRMPEVLPDCIHVDQVLCFFVSNQHVSEVSGRINTPGKKYVKESVES